MTNNIFDKIARTNDNKHLAGLVPFVYDTMRITSDPITAGDKT